MSVRPAFAVLNRMVYSSANYWFMLVADLIGAGAFLALGLSQHEGGALAPAVVSIAGFFGWGLLEYGLHRWILHGPRSMAREGHAQHHSDPKALISTPMFVVLISAVIIWALSRLVMPESLAAFLVFGLYAGYNYFVIVHHWQHHRPQDLARVPFLQRLEHMHHMHHERQIVNFGISTTFWDRLFGTFRAPEEDAH